jgi:acyl-CoA dehydrogenase
MILLNPNKTNLGHLDPFSAELLKKTIDFFENKGLKKIKEDDHERIWYADFIEFAKNEKLFAAFLTPPQYGKQNYRWDTYRNCQLNEILGFYGLAYWYVWQVTVLGLGPIWMSNNELVKKNTAELLEQGEIFAYGLSEKEHGADIYSTEMKLYPEGRQVASTGSATIRYKARGEKYYIGNGNEAAFVSTFGKFSESNDYVFFVVNSKHENYECVQNVVNSQNYVAEIKLNDYPIKEEDILIKGREAWDASLNTVNIGKYNLGWASLGICTHAFYEALNHASHRNLFNSFVTEFTHIKHFFVDSYTRLVAMKLFAQRACDYMRSASKGDRRYLLYNPMVKMKVTSQGEEVINLLWEIIAAKGFEKDGYFEIAARDIRALPKLEGTVHVNMALIIKFMKNYFFNPKTYEKIKIQEDQTNDDFLFNQGPAKGLGKIKFHDYKTVYNQFNSPNVKIFRKQIRLLKMLLIAGKPNNNQIKDFDFLYVLGELFTLVVYGQLILENVNIFKIEKGLTEQIFNFMIRDFSKFALQLFSKTSSTMVQKKICKKMIVKPNRDDKIFDSIYKDHVLSLADEYKMKQ